MDCLGLHLQKRLEVRKMVFSKNMSQPTLWKLHSPATLFQTLPFCYPRYTNRIKQSTSKRKPKHPLNTQLKINSLVPVTNETHVCEYKSRQ